MHQLLPSGWVIDAVVILVPVAVQVVVLEQQVLACQPAHIAVGVASNPENIAGIGKVKLLVDFQYHVFLAIDSTRQKQDTLVFRHSESEGILEADSEGVFAQADFMDCPVMVPGVPVVWVPSW